MIQNENKAQLWVQSGNQGQALNRKKKNKQTDKKTQQSPVWINSNQPSPWIHLCFSNIDYMKLTHTGTASFEPGARCAARTFAVDPWREAFSLGLWCRSISSALLWADTAKRKWFWKLQADMTEERPADHWGTILLTLLTTQNSQSLNVLFPSNKKFTLYQ